MKNRKKSRWRFVGRLGIIFLMIVLFFNVLSLCVEVRRDLSYGNRCYGLSTMNEYFDNGEYYEVYLCTIRNKYAADKPEIDVSQFEAFGRFYEAYNLAKIYENNDSYRQQMKEERSKVTFRKILDVMDRFENELNN